MANYQKDQKINVSELLSIIPDAEIVRIARNTKVDYYTKVLHGRSMFYLLLYGLLESQRSSLRSLEELFSDPKFKYLFHLTSDKTISHSSLSERLSVMDVSFFEQLFDLFYNRLSTLYSKKEMLESLIVRVDSSMIAETSARLKQGMTTGRRKDGKKQIKCTVAFDGLMPRGMDVFTSQSHLNENLCLPSSIQRDAEKEEESKIYVFDQGITARKTYSELTQKGMRFISRLKVGSKYTSVQVIEENTERQIGNLILVREEEVRLYNSAKKLTDKTFRLIIARTKDGQEYWFLTNMFDLDTHLIPFYYKKRWDIEVFFRFLKQELNFSHFFSTSENGIRIIIYMTLILSMLIMIYKRINQWGYKTAKRRFGREMDDLIIKMIVIFCGGDPTKFFGSS